MKSVRESIRCGRLRWRNHALRRLLQRGITRVEVREVLLGGQIIEDYPTDTPFPSALLFATVAGRPLHVVVAYDDVSGYCYIVTVYEPDTDYFESDFKTRRN
ncbi:MAG: DUF4258 domain-containing protein [Planctomycetota bacterium]